VAVCAAATKTCLDACVDDACVEACYMMDPAAEACGECVDDAYIACVNAAGCQAAWDDFMCCAEGCPDPEADACYTVTCKTQGDAFDACIELNDAACVDSVCFKTM
jgi:hypothetical protein